MKTFYLWFAKNAKNKIIVFSIIFLFAFCYVFLHRPLGLIAWYYIQSDSEIVQIIEVQDIVYDESKFLELYNQYDITNRLFITQKELYKYIDDFEIDLLASSFLGLSDLYLDAFFRKNRVYVFSYGFLLAKQYSDKSIYTIENTNALLDFIDKNQKISFFVDRLAKQDDEFERYAVLQATLEIMFIFFYTHFLSQEQICALPSREKILGSLAQFDSTLQKMKDGNKTYEMARNKYATTNKNRNNLDTYTQKMYDTHIEVKERLNVCKKSR
ncbi:hypothetical protein [Helicobacter sp. T3_23-1056]